MFSGVVRITSVIKNPGIRFPETEFEPGIHGVAKATIESSDGREIKGVYWVNPAPTAHAVEDMASDAHGRTMRRLGCNFDLLDDAPQVKVEDLKCLDDPDRCILVARGSVMTMACGSVSVITDKPAAQVRKILEQTPVKGDTYYKLFDQARKSIDETVEFLGYYQIVSAVLGDPEQSVIDDFFFRNDSAKPETTPKPGKKRGQMETVYTRLRNEISHVREDAETAAPVDISKTKSEISREVGRLRGLAAIAIIKFTQ